MKPVEKNAGAAAAPPETRLPAWPIPPTVGCCFTTRRGGVSAPPYDGANLALHVGDDPAAVRQNRAALRARLGLAHEPCWLDQVHGASVHRAAPADPVPHADAAITRVPGLACVVMVADCVPLLLCDEDGTEVAAVHAGWRGLRAGVIGATVAAFAAPAARLRAWIGPHIGVSAYAVGDALRDEFDGVAAANGCFERHGGRLHFNLARACSRALAAAGVAVISDAHACVHASRDDWYSYRRDGVTGRQAALIWIRSGDEPLHPA